MKPKPFASLNHLTVPVVRIPLLLDAKRAGANASPVEPSGNCPRHARE